MYPTLQNNKKKSKSHKLKQQALEPKMLWPGELWQSVQTAGAFS
jgi:hypothetical protein